MIIAIEGVDGAGKAAVLFAAFGIPKLSRFAKSRPVGAAAFLSPTYDNTIIINAIFDLFTCFVDRMG